jgi:hypothetical protein
VEVQVCEFSTRSLPSCQDRVYERRDCAFESCSHLVHNLSWTLLADLMLSGELPLHRVVRYLNISLMAHRVPFLRIQRACRVAAWRLAVLGPVRFPLYFLETTRHYFTHSVLHTRHLALQLATLSCRDLILFDAN